MGNLSIIDFLENRILGESCNKKNKKSGKKLTGLPQNIKMFKTTELEIVKLE